MTTEELEDRYKLLGDIYRKRLADREFYQNELTNDEKERQSLAEQAKEKPDDEEIKNKLGDAKQRVDDDKATIKACDSWVKEAEEARDEFRDKHSKIADRIDQEDRDRAQERDDRKQFQADKEAAVQEAAGHDPNAVPAQGDHVLQGPMARFAAAGIALTAMYNSNQATLDTVQAGMHNQGTPAIERQAEASPTKEQSADARDKIGENAADLDEQMHKNDESKEDPSKKGTLPSPDRSARKVADTQSKRPEDDEPDHRWTRS